MRVIQWELKKGLGITNEFSKGRKEWGQQLHHTGNVTTGGGGGRDKTKSANLDAEGGGTRPAGRKKQRGTGHGSLGLVKTGGEFKVH